MAEKVPVTAAVRFLRAAGVVFGEHLYGYVDHGGTAVAARELGVPEHAVVKTLVMEADGKPLVVLMQGDREVSTKALARWVGAKSVVPAGLARAQRLTGCLVGGTSPFGLRTPLPVYMEASIADLERLWVNGGKRGFLVSMTGADLVRVLGPTLVEVATG